MAENVSTVNNGGTPVLERRLEMPQLVKALDRAIDDERWDRVEGLISRIHEMGMERLGDLHHHIKPLTKALIKLSKRPRAEKHRYFLCQSMERLMRMSAVAALNERLPLLERIPEEDLKAFFELAQKIKDTDPGFYYELNCFYASYWFYCSSYDKEGVADFLKYMDRAVKAVASLKDLDPGNLKELTGELREKFKMLPEKWAIESLKLRSLAYPELLKCCDEFLASKKPGWFGMGYIVKLSRVAASNTADSISAQGRLRNLASLDRKKYWQVRFFACQQLMTLPPCRLNQEVLKIRKKEDRRVKVLLSGQPAYSCSEAPTTLLPNDLGHILRSNQLECLFVEMVHMRQQIEGFVREFRQIRIQLVANNGLIRRSLRMQRILLQRIAPPPRRAAPERPASSVPSQMEVDETEEVDGSTRDEEASTVVEEVIIEESVVDDAVNEWYARFCREIEWVEFSNRVDYEAALSLFRKKHYAVRSLTGDFWGKLPSWLDKEETLFGLAGAVVVIPLAAVLITPITGAADVKRGFDHRKAVAEGTWCECSGCRMWRIEILRGVSRPIADLFVLRRFTYRNYEKKPSVESDPGAGMETVTRFFEMSDANYD